MNQRVEIGYVCRAGHFVFKDDPDGDSCGTKNIGKVYAKPIRGLYVGQFAEAITDALESLHHQIETWRNA